MPLGLLFLAKLRPTKEPKCSHRNHFYAASYGSMALYSFLLSVQLHWGKCGAEGVQSPERGVKTAEENDEWGVRCIQCEVWGLECSV